MKQRFKRLPATQANRQCSKCGCTDENACVDPKTHQACAWVSDTLCSACASPETRAHFRLPLRADPRFSPAENAKRLSLEWRPA
jgi:hypothetical protein